MKPQTKMKQCKTFAVRPQLTCDSKLHFRRDLRAVSSPFVPDPRCAKSLAAADGVPRFSTPILGVSRVRHQGLSAGCPG